MLSTYGLTHTALPVVDLERAIRFYESLLGAEVRYRGGDAVDIGTPGCHDVITLQRAKDGSTGDMGVLGHIGFRLLRAETLDALVQAVEQAGGTVSDSGYFTPGQPYIFAKDPDGYTIELWFEP